jgi:TolB protein
MSRPPVGLGIAAGLCLLTAICTGERTLRAAGAEQVLFSSNSEGVPKLYLIDPDTGATQALHDVEGSESLATWSPDGKKIAFTTLRAGDEEIFVMNADGSDQENLSRNPEADGDPAWCPDGKSILFTSKRDGLGYRLYLMDPDGNNVRMLPAKQSAGGPVFAAWSPDGKRIAYGDEDGAAIELFTCEADGSKAKRLTSLGGLNVFPSWSPDGKRLIVVHWDNREAPEGSLWVVTVPDAVQTRVGPAGRFMSGRPSWKPAR